MAVDRDADAPGDGRANSPPRRGVRVDWQQADLEDAWPDWGLSMPSWCSTISTGRGFPWSLEAVRARRAAHRRRPSSTTQREQGWGPTADAHLLLPGELARLVAPLEIMHGREVLEPVDTERWRDVASVCARNPVDEV